MVFTLNFHCITACGKTFGSQRGLTKHQDRCVIYNNVTGAELLQSVEMAEHANKRPRLGDTLISNEEFPAMDPPVNQNVDCCIGDIADRDVVLLDSNQAGMLVEDMGRGKRKKWRTKRYLDPKPEPPAPLPEPERPSSQLEAQTACVSTVVCRTPKNANGVYREYASRPTYVPAEWNFNHDYEEDRSQREANDDGTPRHHGFTAQPTTGALLPELTGDSSSQTPARIHDYPAYSPPSQFSSQSLNWYSPFLSPTTYRLMNWFWGSAPNKSLKNLQSLADDVFNAEDFRREDLVNFSVKAENRRLDDWAFQVDEPTLLSTRNGWIQKSVDILLPTRIRHASVSNVPRFTVSGLYYRPIIDVIRAAFQSKLSLRFHYTPYKQFWQKAEDDVPVRVFDELYTGESWLKAHADVQNLPRQPHDHSERIIAALMLWQDSTHLTNFGSASLWPLYLYFGNQSKYERARPSSHACHHLAYLPKLPDNITDAFKKVTEGKPPTKETLTHCKRDLMHALLEAIFDEEFKKACTGGMTLLASIKFLSSHPCPRCLVKKSEAHRLGSSSNEWVVKNQPRLDSYPQQTDIVNARRFIYNEGRGVKSTAVEAVLSTRSLVPTSNAFSKALFPLGFNFYRIFVVDFLHEIELGLWKAILVHLIRILSVCGPEATLLLNERYRLVSTFGGDTIRRFTNDASSLKKLAARDYEDLLLCSLPVFDGLFPEPHDSIVQKLLFSLLCWHGLAKLRMQTETTLQLLESAKRKLSVALQDFQAFTCEAYETKELPSERLRRERREARIQARKETTGVPSTCPAPERESTDSSSKAAKAKGNSKEAKGGKRKHFNLNTYKAHAPEHYVDDIREFGTVDSYSTQIGELEHRAVKRYYSRTNKHIPLGQITKIERRENALRQIGANDPNTSSNRKSSRTLPACMLKSREEHHYISSSRNDSIHLQSWLREHIYDPATKSFQRKLKDHLLERLFKTSWENDDNTTFNDSDRNTVTIEYSRLYVHKIFRVNYTTYDGRRRQDSMNPRTHADVMFFAPQEDNAEEDHPYKYARILGVFHAMVRHTGQRSTTDGIPVKMEILWVRWFKRVTITSTGSPNRLDSLSFVSESGLDDRGFGFLDPNQVIRGVHLIPAFRHGKTSSLLCHSVARKPVDEDTDWQFYYVNRFVDRDMYMRYIGGGIGHTSLQLGKFVKDPHAEDESFLVNDIFDRQGDRSNARITGQSKVIFDTQNDEIRSVDDERDDEDSDNISTSANSEDEAELEEED